MCIVYDDLLCFWWCVFWLTCIHLIFVHVWFVFPVMCACFPVHTYKSVIDLSSVGQQLYLCLVRWSGLCSWHSRSNPPQSCYLTESKQNIIWWDRAVSKWARPRRYGITIPDLVFRGTHSGGVVLTRDLCDGNRANVEAEQGGHRSDEERADHSSGRKGRVGLYRAGYNVARDHVRSAALDDRTTGDAVVDAYGHHQTAVGGDDTAKIWRTSLQGQRQAQSRKLRWFCLRHWWRQWALSGNVWAYDQAAE